MAEQQSDSNVKELVELGKQLSELPTSKEVLLGLLKQLSTLLSQVDQSAPEETVEAMGPCKQAIVRTELLRHKDKDVRLLVATCASEIMRIEAPEVPYENDDILKELFELIVSTFRGLDDMDSASFSRRVTILETVANVKSCVLILDLDNDADELVLNMFKIFFSKARDRHPQNILSTMVKIMNLVVKESDEIPHPLLVEILSNLLKKNDKKTTMAAYTLASEVVRATADKLKPHVLRLLTEVQEGKGEEWAQENYNNLIYEIYRCAPQIILAYVPNLCKELMGDDPKARARTVRLLGRMFSIPGQPVSKEFRTLVELFLKRFSDDNLEVRLAAMEAAKECLLSNSFEAQSNQLIKSLQSRLLDQDEPARIKALSILCDAAKADLSAVPREVLEGIASRIRDKKADVRAAAIQKLTELYATHCSKNPVDFSSDQLEWIPAKILKCSNDKEFRPQGVEIVFCEELFAPDLSIEERAKHWIAMFSNFEKIDLKSMERLLHLKQRFQNDMQDYLHMRQKLKEEENAELEKKIRTCFRGMALTFVDIAKVEDNIEKLHQMKDNSIFKKLQILLNPSTPYAEARSTCDDLLKTLGPKHPMYEFLRVVAIRCSFLLFGREHVSSVLRTLGSLNSSTNKEAVRACMTLLVMFAGYFPSLMEGSEDQILDLLKDSEDDVIKEGALQILSKAGHCLKITDARSTVDLTLERLCLEGTRKQAKYAVSAIAALSSDSGLKALSVLLAALLKALENKGHIPTILQSLGCLAQIATSAYETRESDVVKFVLEDLLRRQASEDSSKSDWESRSEECLLKIYGLKTLIKSFLPNKEPPLKQRQSHLKSIMPVLLNLLRFGTISEDIKSSEVDKAHLRLASAKAVLRLSRSWDKEISVEMFHCTVLTVQDPFLKVRQQLLSKTFQFLKAFQLTHKYGCVFPMSLVDPEKDIVQEGKRYMKDHIEATRREAARLKHSELQHHPEYVLTYLVHVLAHHPKFPDASSSKPKAYEPFYRQLYFYLHALLVQEDGKKEDNNLAAVLEIFLSIKRAEDAVVPEKSKNLYILCDIGLHIAKDLGAKRSSENYKGVVRLPTAFYKSVEEPRAKDDASDLPSFITEAVFNQFRASTKIVTQRGNKRGKKAEETSADEDDDEDVPPKKSRKVESTEGDKATPKARGRKSNKEKEEDKPTNMSEDEDVPQKKKRGRPSKEKQRNESEEPKKRGRPKGSKKLKVDVDSPAASAGETKSAKEHKDQRTPRDSDGKKETDGVSTPKRKKPTSSGSDKTLPVKNDSEEEEPTPGRRVKVWWPMDKRYYKGRVKSYNPKTKKHEIAYDDGDKEVLLMKDERWAYIDQPKQDKDNSPSSPRSGHGKSKKKTSLNALVRDDEPQGSSQKVKSSSKKRKEASDDGQHQSENDVGKREHSKVNGSNKAANGGAVEAESSQPAASVDAPKGTDTDDDEPLDSYRSRVMSKKAGAIL